ncbi:phage tail tape measure protein, partial [Streptomyces sp. PH10-H1]|uniref:phage tail tape measure protein n=1 Tax=Streptomyces sp. PH10-H1 TaxID=3046212 RepID=UPI0024BBCA84
EQAMKKAGITQNKLAMDLKQPDGLYVALKDLKDSLQRAGVSGTEADSVLAKIFGGGRSDKAIMSLMQNLDGLKENFGKVENAANMGNFGQSFSKTAENFNFKLKQTEATLVNLGIKLGTVLMPYVEKFLGWVQKGVGWLADHKGAVMALAGAIGTTLVAAVIALGAAVITAIGPEILIAGAIIAVGGALVYAYQHCEKFRNIVDDVGRFLRGAFKTAWHVAGEVIHWFTTVVIPNAKLAIAALVAWWGQHKQTFIDAWDKAVKGAQTAVKWFNQNVIGWVKDRIADLTSWWHQHGQQVITTARFMFKYIQLAAKVWWDVFKGLLGVLAVTWRTTWGIIWDTAKLVWAAISGVVKFVMHNIMNTIGLILDIITGKWGRVWGDMKHMVGQSLGDIISLIKKVTSGFGTLLVDAGMNLLRGLIDGIKSMTGGLGSAMGDVTSFISGFLPHSPAKYGPLSGTGSPQLAGARIGSMLADGIAGSTARVGHATSRLVGAAALSVAGSSGGLGVLSIGGGGGGQVHHHHVTVHVAGSVLADRDLRNVVEEQMLRLGGRNSKTYQPYRR